MATIVYLSHIPSRGDTNTYMLLKLECLERAKHSWTLLRIAEVVSHVTHGRLLISLFGELCSDVTRWAIFTSRRNAHMQWCFPIDLSHNFTKYGEKSDDMEASKDKYTVIGV